MITKLFVVLASFVFFGHAGLEKPAPFTISGTIKDKSTGDPVQYVHVFTVKGEEEAISDAKGNFSFQTWLAAAELATEKEGYQKTVVKLNLPAPKQTVLLTKE